MLLISVVVLSSCMSSTILSVVKPADVDMPSEIITFAVVQRNEAKKGDELARRIEDVFSSEGIGMDR